MNVLEFKGVHRGYGRQPVLQDINFEVKPGEVIGLLGRNGAGKTTLIRLVMGLLEAAQGAVSVFGLDPRTDALAVKRRIGFVAEDQELPPFLKVDQVVAMYRRLYADWDHELARELFANFSLPPDRRVGDLSRGQARQVALLCAVSHRPELLILDEPAGGLDPTARREFLETAIRLLSDGGTTILFSSHHMNDVERMASRLIMIHEHQKWIDSELDEIRQGYCLAQVPAAAELDGERLLQVGACLCARRRGEAYHAVFELDPDSCRRRLADEISEKIGTVRGLESVQCRSINLEEMFIELTGSSS